MKSSSVGADQEDKDDACERYNNTIQRIETNCLHDFVPIINMLITVETQPHHHDDVLKIDPRMLYMWISEKRFITIAYIDLILFDYLNI